MDSQEEAEDRQDRHQDPQDQQGQQLAHFDIIEKRYPSGPMMRISAGWEMGVVKVRPAVSEGSRGASMPGH